MIDFSQSESKSFWERRKKKHFWLIWFHTGNCLKPVSGSEIVVRGIAHVRYIKILTWLRGFLVIFLYLVWFICAQVSSGNCEIVEWYKFASLTLKPRIHDVRILIYCMWAIEKERTRVIPIIWGPRIKNRAQDCLIYSNPNLNAGVQLFSYLNQQVI